MQSINNNKNNNGKNNNNNNRDMNILFYSVFKNVYLKQIIFQKLKLYAKYSHKLIIDINNEQNLNNFINHHYIDYMKSISITYEYKLWPAPNFNGTFLEHFTIMNKFNNSSQNSPSLKYIINNLPNNIESLEINISKNDYLDSQGYNNDYLQICTENNFKFIKNLKIKCINKNNEGMLHEATISKIPEPIANSNNLIILELNNFNGYIDKLPPQLIELRMNKFDNPIEIDDFFPPTLKLLHLSNFNQKLSVPYDQNISILPNQLRKLILDSFNKPIRGANILSQSLEVIKFKSYSHEFVHPLPPNLKQLKLYNNRNNNIRILNNKEIKKYKLKSHTDTSVITQLPESIKSLSVFARRIKLDLRNHIGNIKTIKCINFHFDLYLPRTIRNLYISDGFMGFIKNDRNDSNPVSLLDHFTNLKSLCVDFFNEKDRIQYPKSIKQLRVLLMDGYNEDFDFSSIIPTNQLEYFKIDDSFNLNFKSSTSNFLTNFGSTLKYLDIGHQLIINFNNLKLSNLTSLIYLACSFDNIQESTILPNSLCCLNIITSKFIPRKTISSIPHTLKNLIVLGPNINFDLSQKSLENLNSIYISNSNQLLLNDNNNNSNNLLHSKLKVINIDSNSLLDFKQIKRICNQNKI